MSAPPLPPPTSAPPPYSRSPPLHPPLPSLPPAYLPAMSDPGPAPYPRPPAAPSYTLPSLPDVPTAHHPSLTLTPAPHAPPLPHAPSPWPPQPPARPARPEYPPSLLAAIPTAEEKLRNHPLHHHILAHALRRCPDPVSLDPAGRLVVPGRPRDANPVTLYGFPTNDDDVEYCLEDTPGLSQANFMTLKGSLMDNLAQLRHAVHDAVAEVEAITAQQLPFRVVPASELDARLAHVVGRFCKTRKQILHKYRGYVRNRRWIENVATRQRRGCLTHRQNNILRLWLFSNFSNPYPDNADKKKLIRETQLSMTQINNWLINARSRVWKPTVETMSGERIRKEMTNKADRYLDTRTDIDADYLATSSPTPQNPPNTHPQQHHGAAPGPHVQPQPVVSHGQASASAPHPTGVQVEGLAEDGTWLGPQNWGGLDFPADVNLNS